MRERQRERERENFRCWQLCGKSERFLREKVVNNTWYYQDTLFWVLHKVDGTGTVQCHKNECKNSRNRLEYAYLLWNKFVISRIKSQIKDVVSWCPQNLILINNILVYL